jgi:hypothetical protein
VILTDVWLLSLMEDCGMLKKKHKVEKILSLDFAS